MEIRRTDLAVTQKYLKNLLLVEFLDLRGIP
jgi:hypothetical protein